MYSSILIKTFLNKISIVIVGFSKFLSACLNVFAYFICLKLQVYWFRRGHQKAPLPLFFSSKFFFEKKPFKFKLVACSWKKFLCR